MSSPRSSSIEYFATAAARTDLILSGWKCRDPSGAIGMMVTNFSAARVAAADLSPEA